MKLHKMTDGVVIRYAEHAELLLSTQQAIGTKITQLAFLNRFTDDEAVDIDLASVGNTREAALLRRYLQKVSAATFIDLSRQDLADDLQKLASFNLLTQARVDTILTAPILDHEVYKGS